MRSLRAGRVPPLIPSVPAAALEEVLRGRPSSLPPRRGRQSRRPQTCSLEGRCLRAPVYRRGARELAPTRAIPLGSGTEGSLLITFWSLSYTHLLLEILLPWLRDLTYGFPSVYIYDYSMI